MTEAPNATLETLIGLAARGAAADETLGEPASIGTLLSSQPPPPASAASVDALPDGYEAKQTLGAGAVGTVWLATETSLGRDVAVKVLHANGTHAAHASLLAEAKVLARLEHPSIPPIYALGDERGTPFVAMRRVDGVSMKELAADPDHALWPEWAMGTGDRHVAIVEILTRVAEALAHAHDRGLVHRDVKPANIVVGSLGQAFLVDWGLAVPAHTIGSSVVAGTPAFMAPEMALGGPIDERTDVYLLGATLHSLLTGRPRHAGRSIEEVLRSAVGSQPIAYPPEVPAQLAAVANDATAREPSDRPASVLEMRDRLRDYRRDRSAAAFLQSAEQPLRELDALVGRVDDVALADAERLASVCRFVLRQAAELDRGSDRVGSGRRRVASAVARIYLARGEAGPARAALAELEGKEREALAVAIDELERSKQREAQRVDDLQRALEVHDTTIEARARPWFALAFGCVVAAAVATGRLFYAHGEPSIHLTNVLIISSIAALVATAIVVVVRRRVASSRPNSALAMFVVLVMWGRVMMRLGDRVHGVETFQPAFARDLALCACLALLGGVATRMPLFWLLSAVFVVGMVASLLAPAHTLVIFEVSIAAALIGSGALAGWMARRSAPKSSA